MLLFIYSFHLPASLVSLDLLLVKVVFFLVVSWTHNSLSSTVPHILLVAITNSLWWISCTHFNRSSVALFPYGLCRFRGYEGTTTRSLNFLCSVATRIPLVFLLRSKSESPKSCRSMNAPIVISRFALLSHPRTSHNLWYLTRSYAHCVSIRKFNSASRHCVERIRRTASISRPFRALLTQCPVSRRLPAVRTCPSCARLVSSSQTTTLYAMSPIHFSLRNVCCI